MAGKKDQDSPLEAPTYPKVKSRRKRVPSILQMEAVECGAAALAMILEYYGLSVPLEELRVECGVSRDGSKASNVLKAARKYGLEAKGFKYELDRLWDIDLPVILFWNFNHFLVLEGFKGKKVFIADPATGPREITFEELDASYSGVVLTFTPGPEFKKGGHKHSMNTALRRRLKGSEAALLFVILCGLFLVIPGLVIPTFSRIFIDEYLVGGRESFIRPLLVGMGLTAVLRMILTYLQEYYLLRMETKLAITTSSDFFNHILRLPVTYFSQRYAGEIGSRVQINNKVAQVVSGKLATTMLDCILVVFYAALMFMYDVTLTIVCIAIALGNIAAVKLVARKRVDASRRLLQEGGKLVGTAMNGLKIIDTLKASGSEGEFFSRWAGYQAKALNAEQELGRWSQYVNAVPPLVSSLTTAVILLLGSLKVMDGQLTVGMLVAYQSLMASFTKPLNTFVTFGSTLQELEADMNRLDDVLQYPIDVDYQREAEMAAAEGGEARSADDIKLSGKVEIKNLKFGFSPLGKPLIEDLNLKIDPGQRVAFVGPSGSGKSTVARLIAGLFQPWEGGIYFDDRPREELRPSLIRDSLAVVDQEIFLFSGTVADN
ncbi:MAG: cysteine peptidase family C39 domain-containing protein, partial [Candidatus Sulfomarinibacteraceae bacterium]